MHAGSRSRVADCLRLGSKKDHMLTKLKPWLATPVRADDEQTRRAALPHLAADSPD